MWVWGVGCWSVILFLVYILEVGDIQVVWVWCEGFGFDFERLKRKNHVFSFDGKLIKVGV